MLESRTELELDCLVFRNIILNENPQYFSYIPHKARNRPNDNNRKTYYKKI